MSLQQRVEAVDMVKMGMRQQDSGDRNRRVQFFHIPAVHQPHFIMIRIGQNISDGCEDRIDDGSHLHIQDAMPSLRPRNFSSYLVEDINDFKIRMISR